ncbi:hypothetical protein CA51_25280 [Rosistilla oblonga]|nr:hypothetical protein CA51_25280 [Rosistilla oblonga]
MNRNVPEMEIFGSRGLFLARSLLFITFVRVTAKHVSDPNETRDDIRRAIWRALSDNELTKILTI